MTKQTYMKRAEEILGHDPDCSITFYKESNGERGSLECDCSIDALYQLHLEGVREEIKAELKKLPRKFWEDEDHAVGGYISLKDLFNLLTEGKA